MSLRAVLGVTAGAAIVATAGDLLLLWVAAATLPALALATPPWWALPAGLFAGVLAIPFYGFGYAALAAALPASDRWTTLLVRVAGFVGGALGSAIHGITGTALAAELDTPGAAIAPLALIGRWGTTLVPLWLIATALVVMASALWARSAWRGQARVPRWTAFANPALGTVAIAAAGAATPLLQAVLLPAAPNLAHAAFFALTALTLRR
jgi:hypothetical protein